ncbi:hypothetical protein [Tatumella citrea]|uniref:Uncharacterized protein n=1 Tax=Tatumella citrea TaxID=53336 RepID=A0A1Y0LL55_TATCI|nr:hypothetical protein [Tatumella citrea]ARU94557.1 hypothetical protein A7K98_12760 [Tatumella citrea]ARU98595.1 hypothetical protein A7K99_12750 [Tatumella citrea]
MTTFSHRLAHIKTLDCFDIVDLHFEIQEAIKTAYRLRKDPKQLSLAIELCEESISISDIVIEAMKEKHRARLKEYEDVVGMKPSNTKFFYPSHHGYSQLSIILRRSGDADRGAVITKKIESEGWGSCRYEDI